MKKLLKEEKITRVVRDPNSFKVMSLPDAEDLKDTKLM